MGLVNRIIPLVKFCPRYEHFQRWAALDHFYLCMVELVELSVFVEPCCRDVKFIPVHARWPHVVKFFSSNDGELVFPKPVILCMELAFKLAALLHPI